MTKQRIALCLTDRFLRAFLITLIFMVHPGIGWSLDPSHSPFLQLNSWMHTGDITQISLDAQGRYLASSSKDKTIRLWDLENHHLMFVLRPPIGRGRQGILNSVAFSPDGRTIATGGHTTKGDGSSYHIYLFDVLGRKIVRALPGQASPIYFLLYSPDGNFLVALMGKGSGLRVYRTSDWSLAAEDTSYDGKSYWAAFDRQGRLVTSCMDGLVRLYDSSFKRVKAEEMRDNKKPFGVAFSPDDKKIAVGFTNSTKLEVLSSSDLKPLYSPHTKDLEKRREQNLSVTSWSSDGQVLFASGQFKTVKTDKDRWAIRYWADAGKGQSYDIPVANNSIIDIRPLPRGGVAFSSLDPSIGFLDIRITARATYVSDEWANAPLPHPDFRGIGNRFLVSEDGESVAFSYEALGQRPNAFSVSSKSYRANLETTTKLLAPIMEAKDIIDWKNNEKPKINGHLLQLEPEETSRSLAISPDHKTFVLGAEWNIYFFDQMGKQLWKTETQSPVWGVNLARNGTLAIAALGDGTIRWYRTGDGEELLALFPHPDGKRWILWTPSGYYDVSIGGEDLIGWHVNQGWDRGADFFPIRLFRETYLRPEVVATILKTLDENKSILSAHSDTSPIPRPNITEQLPPVVQIHTLERTVSTPDISVIFGVRSQSPVIGFRVNVNGVPTDTRPPYPETQQTGESGENRYNVLVHIPPKDVLVEIIAENQNGLSPSASVRFHWDGRSPDVIPNLYLLAIGVRNFLHEREIPSLLSADKDAQDLVNTFKTQEGKLYQRVVPIPLINNRAIKSDVKRNLESLLERAKDEDYTILFIAGHGTTKHGIYYFLPYDFDPKDEFSVTGITFSEILEIIYRLKGQVLVFIDTCRSATLFGPDNEYFRHYSAAVNNLSHGKGGRGITVFTSVSGDNLAQEDKSNGEFTKALVEALKGKAPHYDKKITVTAIDHYVSSNVTRRTFGQQKPTALRWGIPDYPVAWTDSSPYP